MMMAGNSSFDCFYQNVRGLRTKSAEFFSSVVSSCWPIIILTETWLCPDISSNTLFPPHYQVFRHDRDPLHDKQRGGGVLIALHDSIKCKRRLDLELESECIWLEVFCDRGERLLVCTYYISPETHASEFRNILNTIETTVISHSDHHFLVTGDFNAPGISWETQRVSQASHPISPKCDFLFDFISFTSLQQCNLIRNSCGNVLDLCLTSLEAVDVSRSNTNLVKPDKFHPSLHISLHNVSLLHYSPPVCTPGSSSYDFARGDYIGLFHFLSNTDWSPIANLNDVDEQTDFFTEVVHDGLRSFVPRKFEKKGNFPRWFSAELKRALGRKNRAHKQAKKTGQERWQNEFRQLRSLCKCLVRRDRSNYIAAVEADATRNAKAFWGHVRSQTCKNSPGNINLIDERGESISDVANAFARQFRSTYGNNSAACPPPQSLGYCKNSEVLVSESLVLKALKQLKSSFSCGPDGIPSAVLKAFGDILVPVLTCIFQTSLKSGKFPARWKNARVVPVFKTGSKLDPTNYRPISILCAASKLFESILHKLLTFSINTTLIPEQHGFFAGRSTTTNLVNFMLHASEAVQGRGQLDVVYFDLSKAFDVVCHELLAKKLSELDIQPSLISLICNYLCDRSCFVHVNGQSSLSYEVTSGVPQGSVLGPLLFSIFINDVATIFNDCNFLLYADDVKIFKSVSNSASCSALQRAISSFSHWCSCNKLLINTSKTKVMTYTRKTDNILFPYNINGELLPRVVEVNDLGVTFDSKLSFSPHIQVITRRALRSLGVVCRVSKEFKEPISLLKLYTTICRPQLEYASVVWNSTSKTNRKLVERVQNKFISIFNHRFGDSSNYNPGSPSSLTLSCLTSRRNKADILFLFKIMHGIVSCGELLQHVRLYVPQKWTRKHDTFCNPNCLRVLCPVCRLQCTYNRYSDYLDIFNDCPTLFRKHVCEFVLA